MAANSSSSLAVLLLFAFLFAVRASALGGGGKVGGRTEIPDVASNKEVQDLGRFSVEEYNRKLQSSSPHDRVTFAKVVKAESQVVAGIKYYLTVAALDGRGARRTFEAVVVVKPWLKSKELVSFSPSAH